MFDFDRVIDRRGTHSMKWDKLAQLSGIQSPDALAMWVADMDFNAPPGVTAALEEDVRRAVHGYYADTGSWGQALAAWMRRRHGLEIDPPWITATPGIVSGLGLITQAVSEPGDEIVMFPPVYHMFRRIVRANGREVIDCPLEQRNGRYHMNLDRFAEVVTPRTKAAFLCSPHNPGGTVWTAAELAALSASCAERGIVLVSDEIHCDLVFAGARHVPTLVAAPQHTENIITCVAATKTFNLAGAHVGACFTSNRDLKKKLDARINASGLSSYNSFGMIATEAAWRTGEAWLDALLPYLRQNRDLFDAGIEAAVPGARSMRLASTYLSWVDFSGTGLSPEEVTTRVKQGARIFANAGPDFGPGGENHLRFNFATPRSVVEEALGRLREAFKDRRS